MFKNPDRVLPQDTLQDLHWLIDPSTDMVTSIPPYERFPLSSSAPFKRWLAELSVQSIEQQALLPLPKSHRIGHLFENLVELYCRKMHTFHPEDFKALRRNVPIYEDRPKGRVTLGELDFTYRNVTHHFHLEVAVKFYMAYNGPNGWQWLGPNSHDSLETKVQRLACHQLPISEKLTPHPNPLRRQFWVKGALFQPWQAAPAPLPDFVNPEVASHFWLKQAQLADFLARNHKSRFSLLAKRHWLSGLGSIGTISATAPLTDLPQHPFMLAATHSVNPVRIMVVPNHWPGEQATNGGTTESR